MAAEAFPIEIVQRSDGVELSVKVVPGASRTRVAGRWGAALKVAVVAPPEAGKANAAVIRLLAAEFGVKRADVAIVSGGTQPLKRVKIAGLDAATARQRLS